MRCNRPFGEFSGEEFDRMVAINVRPAFLASQAVLPVMRRQGGGRIVHVAGQIGLVAQKNAALYGMTKAALIYLARAMAYELATENIYVNSISPGVIMSDTNVERLKLQPELEAERLAEIPMGRYGDPEEIAEAIMYLVAGGAALFARTQSGGGWRLRESLIWIGSVVRRETGKEQRVFLLK
jgi:NAD(P)-dependent dehydrogenase (short-subunit alcohol dehydrogenase family)